MDGYRRQAEFNIQCFAVITLAGFSDLFIDKVNKGWLVVMKDTKKLRRDIVCCGLTAILSVIFLTVAALDGTRSERNTDKS